MKVFTTNKLPSKNMIQKGTNSVGSKAEQWWKTCVPSLKRLKITALVYKQSGARVETTIS